MVTDVHLNEFFYDQDDPTYVFPRADAEVRVKGTGDTVLETGGVNNGHDLIQGDENGEGFIVEYKITASSSVEVKLEWWAWGYNH